MATLKYKNNNNGNLIWIALLCASLIVFLVFMAGCNNPPKKRVINLDKNQKLVTLQDNGCHKELLILSVPRDTTDTAKVYNVAYYSYDGSLKCNADSYTIIESFD